MAGLARGEVSEAEFEAFFGDQAIRELPRAFDRRNARIRASLIVQILSKSLRDPKDGQELDGFKIFDEQSSRDIPYFFPNISAPLISSPANRVIIPASYGRNAFQYFMSLAPDIRSLVADSHLIGEEGLEALRRSDARGFLAHREARIKEAENNFLVKLKLPIVSDDLDRFDEKEDAVSDVDA